MISSADRRGDVAWLTPGLDIETSTGFGSGGRGGFMSGLKQKLSGSGTAWVQLAGEIVEYELAAGQSLLIHPGHLALSSGNG